MGYDTVYQTSLADTVLKLIAANLETTCEYINLLLSINYHWLREFPSLIRVLTCSSRNNNNADMCSNGLGAQLHVNIRQRETASAILLKQSSMITIASGLWIDIACWGNQRKQKRNSWKLSSRRIHRCQKSGTIIIGPHRDSNAGRLQLLM